MTTISFPMECMRHKPPSVGQVGSGQCHIQNTPQGECLMLAMQSHPKSSLLSISWSPLSCAISDALNARSFPHPGEQSNADWGGFSGAGSGGQVPANGTNMNHTRILPATSTWPETDTSKPEKSQEHRAVRRQTLRLRAAPGLDIAGVS